MANEQPMNANDLFEGITLPKSVQSHIVDAVYPGRFIIVGRNDEGHIAVVYGLTGGSAYSQNRDLVMERDRHNLTVRTVAIDPDPKYVPKPELTLYDAIRTMTFADKTPGIVVSNGVQTNDLCEISDPSRFTVTLQGHHHEPDPAKTSRISALIHLGTDGPTFLMSIIKASSEQPDGSDRITTKYNDMPAGEGRFLSTYSGEKKEDGSIPVFMEPEPVKMPLIGNAADIAYGYMSLLSERYRIAVVAITFNDDGTHETSSIINCGKPPEPTA